MDRLKALEVFKSVVDKGSFVKGAEALDISCSAATRAVQELETALGVRLLQRSTRRIAVTAVGQDVLQRASELIDHYRDMEAVSSLSVSEAAGSVRLVAPVSYGRPLLGPALASFRASHPKISVDLRLVDDAADMVHDDADLALCVGRELRLSLIARRVGVAPLGLYASPAYLARRGTPQHPADLQAHDCLTCGDITSGPPWSLRHVLSKEAHVAKIRGVLHSNSADTLTSAAVHGAGIVQLPVMLAADLVWERQLEQVLSDWHAEPLGIYLAYNSRQHQPLRVRKLMEHLLQAIVATSTDAGSASSLNVVPPRLPTLPPQRMLAA